MLPLAPPKVQVYTAGPGEFGVKNILICHVSGFHPPDITIQLMKDGEELSNANQTDLAFKSDWHFHLTKNVAFTPTRGQQFSCKVTHGANMREYVWGKLGSAQCVCNVLLTKESHKTAKETFREYIGCHSSRMTRYYFIDKDFIKFAS